MSRSYAARFLMMVAKRGGGASLVALLPTANRLSFWYAGMGGAVDSFVTSAGDGQAASAWGDRGVSGVNESKGDG